MTDKTPEWLTEGEGWTDVTLSRPLKVDGVDVTVIRMREPTVGDQLAASETKGNDSAKEVAFFANLCEIAPNDIKRLSFRNYARLQTSFGGFID